jgi:hypothetical protein
MTPAKALESLRKAEQAARNAQAARDRAELRWERAMAKLRGTPEWRAYCAENGYCSTDYRFADILA